MMQDMPLTTALYRRETPAGPEALTVMVSIDGDGAEIRVIHELAGDVVDDTIPHFGPDPDAGRRWVVEHHDTWIAEGYHLVDERKVPDGTADSV